jgi:hypothetical protein
MVNTPPQLYPRINSCQHGLSCTPAVENFGVAGPPEVPNGAFTASHGGPRAYTPRLTQQAEYQSHSKHQLISVTDIELRFGVKFRYKYIAFLSVVIALIERSETRDNLAS